MSKWKTHTIYLTEKCYFLAYGDINALLSIHHLRNIFKPKEKFCEIWKLMQFFDKKCVCVFSLCVFFWPCSLLSFGKNLDSKRTIYFEWPYGEWNTQLRFRLENCVAHLRAKISQETPHTSTFSGNIFLHLGLFITGTILKRLPCFSLWNSRNFDMWTISVVL